jgi:hypothetical protein
MQRLIYDLENRRIIMLIDPCDGTVTGTPFEIFEGTAEEVQSEIARLGLSETGPTFSPPEDLSGVVVGGEPT